ncbi:P-type Ca2+ transporter type 2C, partial [Tremellales sp. Uapishka_1]
MTSRPPSPPLIITTDLDSPSLSSPRPISRSLALPIDTHSHQTLYTTPPRPSNASPNHLSASPGHLHPNHSPSPSSHSGLTPPSPTLTNSSSVHFSDEIPTPTSPSPRSALALRENHPTADSGMETLQVVDPDYSSHTHRRGWSVGSWTTEVDDTHVLGKGQHLSPSTTRASAKSSKKERKAAEKEEAAKKEKEAEISHIDPEKDTTDPTPFAEKPSRLAMLVDPKSLEDLTKIGGIKGLLQGLGVDGKKGLRHGVNEAQQGGAPRSSADMPAGTGKQWQAGIEERRNIYGRNDLPERKSKSLLLLMWLAFKDKVLILLSVAAAVSLALGLYQDLGTPPTVTFNAQCPAPVGCPEPRVDWVEGVAIVVAIIIVVMVGSVNDWQKERQFKKLNEKREDRSVKAIRGGNEMVINVKDVVVGDVCLLEPGEIIPVDGVFLRGHNVRCDESGATGESDAIKKFTYDECIEERDGLKEGQRAKRDCFLVSGAKVLEGVGEYVVISVGPMSFNGRIMMAMRGDAEETPLQLKLNRLAELIAKCGAAAGLLLFIALMIRFFVQLGTQSGRSANDKAQSFIQILIISVTLVVVAVPEGLPLAVTLALAFATKRMTKQNLLVRVLGSCETMANATVVCTDKTGTLTQNVMSVVAGSLGVHGKFVRELSDNAARSNANEIEGQRTREDFSFDMADLNAVASSPVQSLLNEAICINSTAFEDTDEDGKVSFVGSKTETALLRFAKELGWADYRQTRESAQIVQMIPFSSELKAMGVVVKSGKKHRLYLKGASEILTKNCTSHIVISESAPSTSEIETTDFTTSTMGNISKTIIFYANQTLRTIALCYRDFESWPPAGAGDCAIDDVPFELLARDMTLIAITGIEDPLRPGVREAVQQCQHAGVAIKMCTGDNVLTARSIANQCGIFTPGGIVMEGPVFRALSDADRLELVPRLQILARSSPEDKKLLVKTLKGMGEVVGVTGDGTNDGPALKLANVGFAMGIAGTEVAKEASDIILMDDSFSNVVLAVMWGRCVNDSVKKFLQFQISVNITAVVITFVSGVASNTESSVLTAVQLLWVNLIMDTFAALALATDPATKASLDRKPDRKNAPLINVDMTKMIVVQAIYQIIVCLVLHFAGLKILGETASDENNAAIQALVFNVFVFAQIFNQLNCRRLDRKFNVFEGFFRNYYFIVIFLIMIAGQILIIEVGGAAFQVVRLGGRDWGISLVLGAISLPIGVLVRMLPSAPIERFMIKIKMFDDPNKLPVVSPDLEDEKQYQYNPALSKVKDNLSTYASIRGGRLRASSFIAKSRSSQLKKADIQLPSLLTMVPTLIAGTVGAGAHWVSNPNTLGLGLPDPAHHDPSISTAALVNGKVQLHPETDKNDPMYKRFGVPTAIHGGGGGVDGKENVLTPVPTTLSPEMKTRSHTPKKVLSSTTDTADEDDINHHSGEKWEEGEDEVDSAAEEEDDEPESGGEEDIDAPARIDTLSPLGPADTSFPSPTSTVKGFPLTRPDPDDPDVKIFNFAANDTKFTISRSDVIRMREGDFKRREGEDITDPRKMTMTQIAWRRLEEVGGVRKGEGWMGSQGHDAEGDPYKPTLSYELMIKIVLSSSARKMLTLGQIYTACELRWPYFKTAGPTWRNSIRHSLSLKNMFENVERPASEGGTGKGGYWKVAETKAEPDGKSKSSGTRARGRAMSDAVNRAGAAIRARPPHPYHDGPLSATPSTTSTDAKSQRSLKIRQPRVSWHSNAVATPRTIATPTVTYPPSTEDITPTSRQATYPHETGASASRFEFRIHHRSMTKELRQPIVLADPGQPHPTRVDVPPPSTQRTPIPAVSYTDLGTSYPDLDLELGKRSAPAQQHVSNPSSVVRTAVDAARKRYLFSGRPEWEWPHERHREWWADAPSVDAREEVAASTFYLYSNAPASLPDRDHIMSGQNRLEIFGKDNELFKEKAQASRCMAGTTLFWVDGSTPGEWSYFGWYYHMVAETLLGSFVALASVPLKNTKWWPGLMGNVLGVPEIPDRLVMPWENDWNDRYGMNKHVIDSLFGDNVIVKDEWQDLTEPAQDWLFFNKVVIVDRYASHRWNPSTIAWNKMALEAFSLPHLHDFFSGVRHALLHSFSTPFQTRLLPMTTLRRIPKVVYVDRQSSDRALAQADHEALVEVLNELNVDFIHAKMEAMSFESQVEAVSDADIMVGVHGNGLTHMMWMPEGGAVVEVFPPGSFLRDYQSLAEVLGHHYTTIWNDTEYRRLEWEQLTGEQGPGALHNGTRIPLDKTFIRSILVDLVDTMAPSGRL